MPALSEFLVFAAVGALAQLIDGALGMAYGVTAASILLGLGLPPVAASASVHYAETFTCGASGLSHLAAGNVRRALFWTLVIPGVIGPVQVGPRPLRLSQFTMVSWPEPSDRAAGAASARHSRVTVAGVFASVQPVVHPASACEKTGRQVIVSVSRALDRQRKTVYCEPRSPSCRSA